MNGKGDNTGTGGGDRGDGDRGGGNNNLPRRSSPFIGAHRSFHGTEQWREAVRMIPEFDGKRESLSRYLGCLEDAAAMVGPEFEQNLMRVAKNKLVSEVWNHVNINRFSNIADYMQYLQRTYDPPRHYYQLLGELGSIVQMDDDTVDDYAYKVKNLVREMERAQSKENGNLHTDDTNKIERMASHCFRRGLKQELYNKISMKEYSLEEVIDAARVVERNLADYRRLIENAICKNNRVIEFDKNIRKVDMNFVESHKEQLSVSNVFVNHQQKSNSHYKSGQKSQPSFHSNKILVENKSIKKETINVKTTVDKTNKNVAEMSKTFIKSNKEETAIAPSTFGKGCENKDQSNDGKIFSPDNSDLSKSETPQFEKGSGSIKAEGGMEESNRCDKVKELNIPEIKSASESLEINEVEKLFTFATEVTINQPVEYCEFLGNRELIDDVVHIFERIEQDPNYQDLVNIANDSVKEEKNITNSEKERENEKVLKCELQISIVKVDNDLTTKNKEIEFSNTEIDTVNKEEFDNGKGLIIDKRGRKRKLKISDSLCEILDYLALSQCKGEIPYLSINVGLKIETEYLTKLKLIQVTREIGKNKADNFVTPAEKLQAPSVEYLEYVDSKEQLSLKPKKIKEYDKANKPVPHFSKIIPHSTQVKEALTVFNEAKTQYHVFKTKSMAIVYSVFYFIINGLYCCMSRITLGKVETEIPVNKFERVIRQVKRQNKVQNCKILRERKVICKMKYQSQGVAREKPVNRSINRMRSKKIEQFNEIKITQPRTKMKVDKIPSLGEISSIGSIKNVLNKNNYYDNYEIIDKIAMILRKSFLVTYLLAFIF